MNDDSTGLADVVDPASYVRGMIYAQQGAVADFEWDHDGNALLGHVRGSASTSYVTRAYFESTEPSPRAFEQGRCSCPVGFNCKHVVALVLTAQHVHMSVPAASDVAPAWERTLDSVLGGPDTGKRNRADIPIAIEITMIMDRPPAWRSTGAASESSPQVLARLVRPGKSRKGWVAGQLSWGTLDQLRRDGEHPAAQVDWLREFYGLYKAGRLASGYSTYASYYARDEKHIDVARFESRQLWPLLEEGAAAGVRLLYGKRGADDVPRDGIAQLVLDVTADSSIGHVGVTPILQIDRPADGPSDPIPVRFMGSDAHGVVYVDRSEFEAGTSPGTWHFGLARMARPIPPEFQRLALEQAPLQVPASDANRFREEYAPRLQRLAPIQSSDSSFSPPAITGPSLVAHATYGDAHALNLTWEWLYSVVDAEKRISLSDPATDQVFRDQEAERAVLAGLDAGLDAGLEKLGLMSGRSVLPQARLDGLDTMRFSTEVLPLLRDAADVVVEVSGEPADYREAGDSLVVGVSTRATPGETDWFDLRVTISVEGRDVPFVDVFTALARNQAHLLLPDGAFFSLEKPALGTLRKLIDEARTLGERPDGETRISRFQAGLWEELAALGVVDYQAEAWRRQVGGLLSVDSADQTEPPRGLDATLRPYQLEGYRWLRFLWEHQLGGILADDMGLGKTLQALALICHVKEAAAGLATQPSESGSRTEPAAAPFLVVAPTSVVSNWVAEAARFTPGLTVVAITDTLRRRRQSIEDVVAGADVVVTTYTLLRLDTDAYTRATWSGMVLDEAQHVKNHQSKTYLSARQVQAPFKVAITGTPIENNLMELWSQLSITAPGLFPHPARFNEYYARPIEKQENTELLAQLRRRIRPLVKRRTKEQVATDLPAKQEQVLEVHLQTKHRSIYQKYLQRERQKVLGLLEDVNKNRFTILRSLTLLRQLSLHAGLVDDEHRQVPSAKIEVLVEQLADVVDGGHRALVFSQFTSFLGMVKERLGAAGVEYCYLDGSTRRRDEVIARFKDGAAPVFLISLKAGGFGLNLTEADYCFLLDPWWNPATEAQAVDRTHRIGQTRNVMVYRLIAADTIEEKVMALKARKAELSASVMDDGNLFGTGLDVDDVRRLLE
ncbi:DEAD/DEAH box helicase [Phytoactinopolyspora alkaliphila]|uniref:DEAD/DEAH box helicase n=2 Tax=Phytoactinopolyspora alkaliphila TaxID=1783498 RepID=A0A6N9YPT3_9ACTN|nr:DEAD/DEAH box helicase [Phytoactinopolyspora alkaliphila]